MLTTEITASTLCRDIKEQLENKGFEKELNYTNIVKLSLLFCYKTLLKTNNLDIVFSNPELVIGNNTIYIDDLLKSDKLGETVISCNLYNEYTNL